ncbi:uncharacterized protein LOC143288027 [Babylonia areolata]|uniref:uncharacterized protein LOC143288027 n=1 Tax=Babylonia areolata TaxID=304850 RepID=UPI003FD5FDE2
MEKSVALVHKGSLVFMHQGETSIELESYKFLDQTDFRSELVSKSTVASKLHWRIKDAKNIIDNRSGIEAPVILVSYDDKSVSGKRFCVIQTKWSGSCVTSHKNDRENESRGKSVHLVPLMEFTYPSSLSNTFSCSLLHGPRVLTVSHSVLLLFSLKSNVDSNGKNTVYKYQFSVCDAEDNRGAGNGRLESTILCVASEENWIVTVLQVKEAEGKSNTSIVTVAIEKHSQNGEFMKNTLKTRDFLPPEYAPKVSSAVIHHCQRTETVNRVPVYKNKCAVGLNDGYVITLDCGVVQTCVTLWTHIDAVYPAFGVTSLQKFHSNILICLTDTKHCFIVDETTKQVKHHWDNVDFALVGDFLQCGGQQLLLVFSDCVTLYPPDSYLLADLQGFVADRRHHGADGSLSVSEENFVGESDEASRNLQPVVDALLEQNQGLARSVAEEKQRLASKEQFVAETWRRLLDLSLKGAGEVPDLSPPEVPLVTVVGGRDGSTDTAKQPDRKCRPLPPPPPEPHRDGDVDVKVQGLWHRLLDGLCVVGIRIVNISHRELFSCALALTPSTNTTTTTTIQPLHHHHHHHQTLSAKTTVWQCFLSTGSPQQPAAAAADTAEPLLSASPSSSKRRRKEANPPCFSAKRTQTVQPSESVTVTGVLAAVPDLGWFGEVTYRVHLVYAVKEPGSHRHEDAGVTVPGADDVATQQRRRDVEGNGGAQSGGGRQGVRRRREGAGREEGWCSRVRSVACGEVVLTAAELLRRPEPEWAFGAVSVGEEEEGLESGRRDSDTSRLEAEVLTLNSVQRQWRCDIDFALGEPTGEVIGRCLRSAGFVHHHHHHHHRQGCDQQCWLGAEGAPQCLRLVRVRQLGFAPLPRRAVSVLVFARDSNQLLLLLRHLYAHLPDDATITLVPTSHLDLTSDPRPLVRLLSAQLTARRRHARALLNPPVHGPDEKLAVVENPQTAAEEEEEARVVGTRGERMMTAGTNAPTKSGSTPENLIQSEREAFAEQKRLYQRRQWRVVGREEVAEFRAAVQETEREVDMAVAEVKSL